VQGELEAVSARTGINDNGLWVVDDLARDVFEHGLRGSPGDAIRVPWGGVDLVDLIELYVEFVIKLFIDLIFDGR